MTDPMAEIREGFFAECEELLESLQDALQDLASGLLQDSQSPPDTEAVNVCFRAVHSIKGGAGAFGLEALVAFAHRYETAMDLLRSSKINLDDPLMRLLFHAADLLQDHVRAAHEEAPPPEGSDACLAELDRLTSADAEPEPEVFEFQPLSFSLDDSAGDDWKLTFQPQPALYRLGNEPLFLLRALTDLGAQNITCEWTDIPDLSEINEETADLRWTATLPGSVVESDVREIFEFVDGLCELVLTRNAPPIFIPDIAIPEVVIARAEQEPSKRDHAPESTPTVRVNLERIDRLVNLVGELVITQAMMAQSVAEANLQPNSSIMTGLDSLTLLTREIQDSVMMIRAQPVKPLFQRMARIAREASAATEKSVVLKTEGDATEVDKTVLERLADPLTHMIRNAVDHGIETPDKRLAAGKSAAGNIMLSAQHRSGRLLIELTDDGAGINRKRVFETAVERGLISPDAELTDGEIDNLLFLPGFSTAKEVSALSGRGVGMDVVKSAIHTLGGRIAIQSEPGHGTRFSISLPLTLAVLDGMVVTIGEETLVVPLSAILETATLLPQDVRSIGTGASVMQLRESFVPLYDLGAELGYCDPRPLTRAGTVLLTAMENESRAALIVDAIVEQRQVVIKGLHDSYGHIPGIAAATILGDGRIALILDPADLVQNALYSARNRDTTLAMAV